VTFRQYLHWQAWVRDQWNEPSRTDLMVQQLTLVVARIMAKHPDKVKFADFDLKFKFDAAGGQGDGKPLTLPAAEMRQQRALSAWLGRMTMRPTGLPAAETTTDVPVGPRP
jgi:hypothetical protein